MGMRGWVRGALVKLLVDVGHLGSTNAQEPNERALSPHLQVLQLERADEGRVPLVHGGHGCTRGRRREGLLEVTGGAGEALSDVNSSVRCFSPEIRNLPPAGMYAVRLTETNDYGANPRTHRLVERLWRARPGGGCTMQAHSRLPAAPVGTVVRWAMRAIVWDV